MGERVLVVDDFDDVREMYAAFLEARGYEVITAVDGVQALEIATTLPCDLIVLDIALPRMDGITVIRKLRERGVSTPIITLSASTFPNVEEQVLAAGGDLALEKPCLPDELEQTIRSVLRKSAGRTG
jgi:DNA-binding response OmpR family regulator